MARTRAELNAMAAFLLSEKMRHQEDIDMIQKKLDLLASRGIVATKEADWITEEDITTGEIIDE